MYHISVVLIYVTWILCHSDVNGDAHQEISSASTMVRGKQSIPDFAYKTEEMDNAMKEPYKTPISDALSFPDYFSDKTAAYDIVGSKDDFSKRGRFGFFAMRGKKIGDNPTFKDFKRTRMGFFATRGKKDNDDFTVKNDKRHSPFGFYAVRGKKGVRGKKYPYDCRHRFLLGDRKTMDPLDDLYFDDGPLQRLDLDQLMSLLDEQNEVENPDSQ